MQQIRSAGLNERRCIARDVLGLYGSIVTCATYNYDGSGFRDVPRDDIIKALKQCIAEHPALYTVITDAQTEKPQLARCSSLNLSDHLRFETLETTQGESELVEWYLGSVHNEPFDALDVRPPWRIHVQLLPPEPLTAPWRFRLSFAHSHTLIDGTSSLLFHKSFARAFQEAAKLPYDSTMVWDIESSIKALAPPLEDAAKLAITWSFLLRPLLNEFLPARLVQALGMSTDVPSNLWTGATKRPSFPDKLLYTAVRTKLIPPATVAKALTACRARQVRLTGLLVVVVAKALSTVLRARELDFDTFDACTAIDLRRYLPGEQDGMVNYVSSVTDRLHLKEHESSAGSTPALTDEQWAIAKCVTEHQQRAASTTADQPVALLKYLSNFREWTSRSTAKPAEASFDVSNLGVFHADSPRTSYEHKWRMSEMVFSQSANGTGSPLNINVMSLKDGPLAFNVTWWPGMLGLERGGQGPEPFESSFVDDMLSSIWRQLHAMV